LASFSKGITYQSVLDNLNILDHDYYFKITNSILDQDISNALLTFNEIMENGFDGHHFINGLASHFRDLLVSKDTETLVLLEKGKVLKEQYLSQSKLCEQSFLLKALDICNSCDVQYKTSKNQQLLVELTLMKLCSIGIEELKKKTTNSIKLPTSSPKQEKVVADAITEIKKEEQKVEVLIEKPKQTQTNGVEIEKQDSKISQLISISDLPDPLKDEQRQETIKDKKKNEFNNEELQKVWQEYISIQKEKGKPNFATTLDMNSPVLKEGNQVEILISNKSQEIVIEKEKIDLHEYLRKKLENDAIEVITKIQENNKEKVPYTNKDKYEQMTKENPKLQSLKEKLGLDFDF
jgi:DNA polymerase-3 subunit gamma/tau